MSFARTFPIALALLLAPAAHPANLAYSTYLKDGFTPTAMTADTQGNLYIAGASVIDPVAGTKSAVVIKLDPNADSFRYLAYLDSAAYDSVNAITVDSAGNAYVAGSTSNPNFPATGGQLGAPPTGVAPDTRSFVTKLGPDGGVVFSVLVGGSASSLAEAIALTSQGPILISGIGTSSGFPVTPGAYSVADSNRHPFLMELDPTGASLLFSATGIGGSSLALDGAGDIYVSGSTTMLDYPTTPGAYQTTFTPSFICYGLCQLSFSGEQQYLSKVDAAGSRLIYSTGINHVTTADNFGSSSNTGLAVDAAGNAYVTGVLQGGTYAFTVALAKQSAVRIRLFDEARSGWRQRALFHPRRWRRCPDRLGRRGLRGWHGDGGFGLRPYTNYWGSFASQPAFLGAVAMSAQRTSPGTSELPT